MVMMMMMMVLMSQTHLPIYHISSPTTTNYSPVLTIHPTILQYHHHHHIRWLYHHRWEHSLQLYCHVTPSFNHPPHLPINSSNNINTETTHPTLRWEDEEVEEEAVSPQKTRRWRRRMRTSATTTIRATTQLKLTVVA